MYSIVTESGRRILTGADFSTASALAVTANRISESRLRVMSDERASRLPVQLRRVPGEWTRRDMQRLTDSGFRWEGL